ncbi:MAG: hypothetical protein H7Z75_10225 [Ferruginibacter sp.]|nr:hypothetical protein [Cytophagales bacterium]
MPATLAAASVAFTKVPYVVQWAGEMRNVMQKGDLRAYISLDSLADKPHLYALEPVEGLQGEIIILDSKPAISSVKDSRVG